MKKKWVTGIVILFIGGLIGKFIGAFYRIPLANILGADGIGIYQMIFPLFSFAFVFASGGIPFALSKFVARARAKNQYGRITAYFFSSLIATFIIGFVLSLIFIVLAKPLANFQGMPNAYLNYYAIAIALLFSCLLCSFRGLFQGYENMVPTFLSQIIEQVFKLIFGILLSVLFIEKGLEWGVFGAFLGMGISELLALFYLIIQTIVSAKKEKVYLKKENQKISYKRPIKIMFSFAFLLTLSALILPLVSAFHSLMVVKLIKASGLSQEISTMFFGIQSGMIGSIISFPTILSTSVAIILIPSLSFFLAKKNMDEVRAIIKNCLKLVWIFVLPCAFGMFVLSEKILAIAFSNAIPFRLKDVSVRLMQISSFSVIFISISQITTVILQSIQAEKKAFLSLFVYAFSNFVLTFVLCLKFNIFGFAYAQLISYAIFCFTNLYYIYKTAGLDIGFREFFVPLFASFCMSLVVFVINKFLLQQHVLISALICVLVGVVFYFACLVAFGVFSLRDIKNFIKKKTYKKVGD